MTGAHYLLQSEADIPLGEGWMSASERERLACFPVEKRRRDWRLGRWAAKRALAALDRLAAEDAVWRRYSLVPLATGVPIATRDGVPLGRPFSLSHSHGVALVLIGSTNEAALGCDLEQIEPRVRGFEDDYLTDDERRHVARCEDRALATTLFWTGKESVMKAVGEGLRLPAKAVEVAPDGAWPGPEGSLVPFVVRRPAGVWQGHWGLLRGLAAAFALARGSATPKPLDLPYP